MCEMRARGEKAVAGVSEYLNPGHGCHLFSRHLTLALALISR